MLTLIDLILDFFFSWIGKEYKRAKRLAKNSDPNGEHPPSHSNQVSGMNQQHSSPGKKIDPEIQD